MSTYLALAVALAVFNSPDIIQITAVNKPYDSQHLANTVIPVKSHVSWRNNSYAILSVPDNFTNCEGLPK